MRIARIKYLLLLFALFAWANAQVPVLDLNSDTLYLLNDKDLSKKDGEVLYSFQGNIVFKGASTSYKKIEFTLAIDSLQQKKEGKIYNSKGASSAYTLKESILYFTKQEQKLALAIFAETDQSWAIYNALNDSLLAFIPNKDLSNASLFAVYFALWNDLKLETQINDALQVNSPSDGIAYMQQVFGNGIVWIWDGRYLYPNGANSSSSMFWILEGDKLYPRNYPRTQEEWQWDGSSLKPYWGGNPQGQWTWQNGILRQVWNNNYQNEYFIEDGVIRKRFGSFGDNEWEIHGDIPLPIITAVVLGILYR